MSAVVSRSRLAPDYLPKPPLVTGTEFFQLVFVYGDLDSISLKALQSGIGITPGYFGPDQWIEDDLLRGAQTL